MHEPHARFDLVDVLSALAARAKALEPHGAGHVRTRRLPEDRKVDEPVLATVVGPQRTRTDPLDGAGERLQIRELPSRAEPDRCAAARDAALPFVDEFNVREFLPERTEEEEPGQFAFGRAAS